MVTQSISGGAGFHTALGRRISPVSVHNTMVSGQRAVIDQRYETADGYVWKYMYRLTTLEFEAYNAAGFIPITGMLDNDPTPAGGGKISDIVVTNRLENDGYVAETGTLLESPDTSGILTVFPRTSWSPSPDYYNGQTLYATNPNGVSKIFERYKCVKISCMSTVRYFSH